jgi:CarboxypepD_reg-like domain/TonB-dependent Receptor Plug Domain
MRKKYRFALIFLISFITLSNNEIKAQGNFPVSGDFINTPFEVFIQKLEKESSYKFYFNPAQLDTLKINKSVQKTPVLELLNQVLSGTGYYFTVQAGNRVFILEKKARITEKIADDFFTATQNSKSNPEPISVSEKNITAGKNLSAQENKLLEIGLPGNNKNTGAIKLTGYVRNIKTGEALAGAVVYTDKDVSSVMTDSYGYYNLSLNPGRYTLFVSNAGMKTVRRQILIHESGKFDLSLQEDVPTLKTVVIVAEKNSNIRRMQMGVEKLTAKEIKKFPILLGEPDILRVVMSLPGVTSVSEASTGFNVRGGSADQNLVLYNDATIYNPSHLFGFFSAFNAESVKSVDLYKSSIPSKYGGRLASVLDISGREGNNKEWKGSAGISMLTGKFSVEGPIVKDKTSILLSGRATYSDWLLRQIENPSYNNSTASFADIDLHLNHSINDRNKISLTVYGSQDAFQIANDSLFKYGNRNIVFRWRHVFNNKLSMALATGYDNYKYTVSGDEGTPESFKLSFSVSQPHFRAHFNYTPNNRHLIEFGMNNILYQIQPGTLEPNGVQSLVKPFTTPAEKGLENALYISDKYSINSRLSIEGGIRYSFYQYIGPRDVFKYIEGLPRTVTTITDTVSYKNGQVIQKYHGPEFRLAIRYSLNERSAVKASYNSLRQYLHLLSNTAAISPIDIWKLSDSYIKPQLGQQISLGYYLDFPSKNIETSVEIYYKTLRQVLDFKSGASIILNEHPETEVINTKGKAYGVELMIKKNNGKLNGWLSYTFSRSMLKMDDSLAGQLINKGNFYPANFDKPHVLNLVSNYKFTHRFGASLNIAYSTGRPITLPIAIFNYAGSQRIYYSERNQYRIPDYFRIDLAFNIDGNHKVKQKIHSSWTVGVYNLTGRENPYSVYFTEENGVVKGYQLAVIGNIIPYVTVNLNF